MANRRTKAKPKVAAGERQVPMVWGFPEDMISGYATNMLVQAGEHELYVSFFEAPPPVLLGPEDVKNLESVNAECIARIIIAPERMPEFIGVLQKQLDTFNQKKQGKKA